jgi:hypothetical protein
MAKKTKKRNPKIILRLPDLEQSKTAVLNSPSSLSSDVPTITLFGTSSNGTAQNPPGFQQNRGKPDMVRGASGLIIDENVERALQRMRK